MKTKTIYFLFLVIAFDLLFYKQIPGINIIIFGVILLTVCIIQNPKIWLNKKWLLIAGLTVISSAFVGIYSDVLSFIACCISFTLLSAYSIKKDASIWVATSGFVSTYIKSPYILLKTIQLQMSTWQNQSKNLNMVKAKILALTLVVVILFFFLYRNSSLLFYDLTLKINLKFISLFFFIFTLNAVLLILTFQKFAPINKLQSLIDKPEKYVKANFTKTEELEKRISIEQFACVMLLSSLNTLLIIVNILDLGYILNQNLPQGISYSDFIHQGVGTLILSIVLAISIILYFFRKDLNFSTNKWLKLLAYIWVIQNLFMVISSVSRNWMYIEALGLTEKRIGVYFYLLLSAIGLLATLIKIYKNQSNAFLIRSTSFAFFIVLLASCTINWDNLITKHNLLRNDADKNFDYLNKLSYSNIPQLIEFVNKSKSTTNIFDHRHKSEILHKTMLKFIQHYQTFNNWQSFSYLKNKTYETIVDAKITDLYLQDISSNYLSALAHFPFLENIEIRNSSLRNLSGLSQLQKIKRLSLINCNITDINFIYRLKQIEYLDISENNIENFRPLFILKNLKELHVSDITAENLKLIKAMLPQTEIVFLRVKSF